MAGSAKSDKPKGTWRQWLGDLVLRGLIKAALSLPLRLRLGLMEQFTSRVLAPLAGYQSRAEANLAHVWPHLSVAERRRIARGVARQTGRTLIENYDMPGLCARMANADITGPGYPDLIHAKETGRPVVLLTAHFGNFEAPRAALVSRGFQVGGLYRPMKNPYFNAHYAANMEGMSGPVFAQGSRGTAGLVRHIRNGGMAVLLFDIFASGGEVIDFLGQPAPTMLSAAEIALRTNALLIPFWGIRRPDGQTFEAHFEAPIPHSTPLEMMQDATRRLERQVEAHPEQWFWIHRRWKPERQAQMAATAKAPARSA